MTAADQPSAPEPPSTHASTSAASQLPPAFPGRAPWGTAERLRAWQAEALERYRELAPRDFLAVATPGLFGPAYFREIGEVAAAAAGGPPDIDAMMAVMRRHGLTPAPPAG